MQKSQDYTKLLVFYIGSWSILSPIAEFPITTPPAAAIPVSPELSPQALSQLAQSITVKVFAGDTSGSGILIRREGQLYTVVTNEHVLLSGYGKSYRIQTPDGRIYLATVSREVGFDDNDLGVLLFRSGGEFYPVASLANSECDILVAVLRDRAAGTSCHRKPNSAKGDRSLSLNLILLSQNRLLSYHLMVGSGKIWVWGYLEGICLFESWIF